MTSPSGTTCWRPSVQAQEPGAYGGHFISRSRQGRSTELHKSKVPQLLLYITEKKKTKTAAELGMVVHTWSPNI